MDIRLTRRLAALLALAVWVGCSATPPPSEQARPVTEVLEKPAPVAAAPTPTPGVPSTAPIVLAPDSPAPETTTQPVPVTRPAVHTGAAIASVNNLPVSRDRLVELLVTTHGLDILQQLISLEAVEQSAQKRNLRITESDVQAEYKLALDAITPASVNEREKPTPEQKRKLLDEVLRRRGMSFEEFMLGMRRNAWLRKLAQKDLSFTEDQLQDEFNRTFGAKVQVRHIVCAKQENIEAARTEAIQGKDFADVARKYSEDSINGPRGGLLPPFSAGDTEVPQFIRDAAFELAGKPGGTMSNILKVKGRYHLLKVEKVIPPTLVKFEEYRDTCQKRLTERTLPSAMSSLHELIIKQAKIQIYDPTLQEQFEERRKTATMNQPQQE